MMRYATWKIDFSKESNYGTGPETQITSGEIKGGFEISPFFILGYVSDDAIITNLNQWEVTEVTPQEALDFALSLNPEAFISENGYILSPSTVM